MRKQEKNSQTDVERITILASYLNRRTSQAHFGAAGTLKRLLIPSPALVEILFWSLEIVSITDHRKPCQVFLIK